MLKFLVFIVISGFSVFGHTQSSSCSSLFTDNSKQERVYDTHFVALIMATLDNINKTFSKHIPGQVVPHLETKVSFFIKNQVLSDADVRLAEVLATREIKERSYLGSIEVEPTPEYIQLLYKIRMAINEDYAKKILENYPSWSDRSENFSFLGPYKTLLLVSHITSGQMRSPKIKVVGKSVVAHTYIYELLERQGRILTPDEKNFLARSSRVVNTLLAAKFLNGNDLYEVRQGIDDFLNEYLRSNGVDPSKWAGRKIKNITDYAVFKDGIGKARDKFVKSALSPENDDHFKLLYAVFGG